MQRQFDVENEKDMQDLWDIVPDDIVRIRDTSEAFVHKKAYNTYDAEKHNNYYITTMLKINWHDKTEITRPIKEATEADVGKLCYFWEEDEDGSKDYTIGLLAHIDIEDTNNTYHLRCGGWWEHARRLTRQEIEELC